MPIFAFKEFDSFIGLNNRLSPQEINPNELTQADNIDITNEGYLKPRKKIIKLSDGNYDNLYVFQNNLVATKDGNLIYIDENLNEFILKENYSNLRVSYCEAYNKLILTNNREIGFIEGWTYHSFNPPDKELRLPMPAGHLLDFFNGRLLVAQNNTLFFSDPMDIKQMKAPDNFIQFNSFITNLGALKTGIYISIGNTLYFIEGQDISKSQVLHLNIKGVLSFGFTHINLDFFGEKTPIKEYLNYQSITVEDAIFIPTVNGMFVGLERGKVISLTNDRIKIDREYAYTTFVNRDQINQIISMV